MAASPSASIIRAALRKLEKKTGEKCRVIRASNGEVAIVTESWYQATVPQRYQHPTNELGWPK